MQHLIAERGVFAVGIATYLIVESNLTSLRSNSESSLLINSHCVKLRPTRITFHELCAFFKPGINLKNTIRTDGLEGLVISRISILGFRMNINHASVLINNKFTDEFLLVHILVVKYTVLTDDHHLVIVVVE